jgi:hypothetical protein
MNDQLQQFARQTLNVGLSLLTENHLKTFKLMYGRDNGKRSVDDVVAMPIEDVVKEIPSDKLDLAMQQVQHSLEKLETAQ